MSRTKAAVAAAVAPARSAADLDQVWTAILQQASLLETVLGSDADLSYDPPALANIAGDIWRLAGEAQEQTRMLRALLDAAISSAVPLKGRR